MPYQKWAGAVSLVPWLDTTTNNSVSSTCPFVVELPAHDPDEEPTALVAGADGYRSPSVEHQPGRP